MLHGLATNLAFWYPLAQVFAETYPTTLFDLRGHGRSSMPLTGYTPPALAEDLRELLDHLGIMRANFIGHSFGGSVLLCFAHRYPERVHGLVLADVRLRLLQPSQEPKAWPNWSRLGPNLEKVGIHLADDEPEGGYRLLEEMMRWELRGGHKSSDGPIPKVLEQLLPPGGSRRTAERWVQLLEGTTARQEFLKGEPMTCDQLAQLHKPTLAVYGENSPTLPTAHALKELWPHTQFEFVPHAGHFFPLSKPERLLIPAQKFLAGCR